MPRRPGAGRALHGLAEAPLAPPRPQRAGKLGDAAHQQASAAKDLAVYCVKIRIGRDEPETAGHANCDPDHTSFCFDHETVHGVPPRCARARGPWAVGNAASVQGAGTVAGTRGP